MTKKQRNRKTVQQNKRNRMINRRYSSSVKTLVKLFEKTVKQYQLEVDSENKLENKEKIKNLKNNLYSVLDKAVKKNVIHKNKAARKKSSIHKISITG